MFDANVWNRVLENRGEDESGACALDTCALDVCALDACAPDSNATFEIHVYVEEQKNALSSQTNLRHAKNVIFGSSLNWKTYYYRL